MAHIKMIERLKPVDASAGCVTTNGGVTGKYVSAKNALRLGLLVSLTQAVGFAEVLAITQASAIAGTGVKTGPTCQVWYNATTAATDTWVKQTSGASFTTGAGIAKMQVYFDIDPAALDVANGFYVLGWTASDSSQATNFVSAVWLVEQKYAQATPPSSILDAS